MVFSETVFLFIFLPITLLVYFNPFIKTRGFRNYFLLIASVAFYGYGEPYFLFVMLLFAMANWAFGLLIEWSGRKKRYLILAIGLDVMLLIVYKYLGFVCSNIFGLIGSDRTVPRIALPIGISFFTFQMMSYLFDIYYHRVDAQRNVLKVLLYFIMFPQLVAGPIVRYETIANEISVRNENRKDYIEGVGRFVFGLSKKVLLADYLALLADNVFANFQSASVATLWLGAIAYTFQIYFDFSGYSDMAIGLGRIFGFHFSENFNYPYIAKSVTEFWRRWHISLSSWFKDYIYIPLGGQNGLPKQIRNMLIVWFLTGIWHGANWTFVSWGLLYFIVLSIEKVIKKFCGQNCLIKEKENVIMVVLGHFYTMVIVIIAWVLFRAENMSEAVAYIGGMFTINGRMAVDGSFLLLADKFKWILALAVLVSNPCMYRLLQKIRYKDGLLSIASVGLLVLSLAVCVHSTFSPFIYFNF